MYLYNLYTCTSHEGDAHGFLSKHFIVVISLTVCTYHTESVTQGTDKESGDYVLANKRRVIQFVQEWHRIIAEAFWEDNTICAFVEVSPNYRILPHMPNKRIGPIFHGYRVIEWPALMSWKNCKTRKAKLHTFPVLPSLQTSAEFCNFSSSFMLSLFIFAK